jgi:hypothetical protein
VIWAPLFASSIAYVGSYILTKELERGPEEPSIAFDNYERAMRPFIKSKEPASFAFMRILLPSSPLGIRLFHFVGNAARVVMLNISKLRAMLSTVTGRDRNRGSWTLPDHGDSPSPAAGRPMTQNVSHRGGHGNS